MYFIINSSTAFGWGIIRSIEKARSITMCRIIYYSAAILLNIMSIFILHHRIQITATSMIPALLSFLSFFLAFYYAHNRENDTTYSTNTHISEAEWRDFTSYISHSHLMAIPLYLPFIWFFSSWIKLLSILLFLLTFIGSSAVFRIKHGKALQSRNEKEKNELQKQKRKEELGQWK